MEAYQLENSEEEVIVLVDVGYPKKAAGREAPGVTAAKNSESRKGE